MNLFLKSALFGTALVLSGAAIAQPAPEGSAGHPMPLCSKTVKDECMNPSLVPRQAMPRARHTRGHRAIHHRARHHRVSHNREAVERL